MNNNPYDNNYPENTPDNTPENINSSVNPEDTVHINDSTPDYTPDEYYQRNYADKTASADNYAKYGESFYSENNSQPANSYSPRNNEYNSNSYPGSSYPGYNSAAGVQNNGYYNSPAQSAQNNYGANNSNPVNNYGNTNTSSANYKKKKEKKPVTRGTVAAILVVGILFSSFLGAGSGFLAASIVNNSNSTSGEMTVSKSNSKSSSYSSSTSAMTTTEIVKKTADSVVEVTTQQVKTGSFSQQYIQKGAGSGVIISKDGYIITNYHVIEGASKISVTLRDKTEYTDVKVVGTYAAGDIALLKVKAKKSLPYATFGDSSKLSVGDYAVVIGNPLGQLGGTVTDGIISALDREVTIDNQTMNLLQTNSEISPGNSGGGLFNGNGELVGIVNAKSSSNSAEGIGFAIPINDVQDVLSDLKKYGYVKGQVDLGMSLSDISSQAQLWMYGTSRTGVYVTNVTQGSNAAKSGFQAGDIITKVNGTSVKSTAELNALIKKMKVGDTVTFTVYRGTQTGTIKMKLAEYTKDSNFLNGGGNNNNDNGANDFGDDGESDGGSIWDYFD